MNQKSTLAKERNRNFWWHVYIEIMEKFFSFHHCFRGEKVIFHDYDTFCPWEKGIKAFLLEKHLKSMSWPMNTWDLNPTENQRRNSKRVTKRHHERRSINCHSGKNRFDKEYCFELVESMLERIKVAIKIRERVIRY